MTIPSAELETGNTHGGVLTSIGGAIATGVTCVELYVYGY